MRLALKIFLAHALVILVLVGVAVWMHGFEVLQALRGHPELQRSVIIVTSAKLYKRDIERARQLGATESAVKPFRAEELLALVERHLAAAGGVAS